MGKRIFKPTLVPTIAFILVLPVLISLGLWQLDRAKQKETLQLQYDLRNSQPPISLGKTPVDPAQVRYYKVEAVGTYNYAYEFLVDNRVHDRKVGYHVITPLQINDTQTMVLVNRGWVLGNPDRSVLPETKGPQHPVRIQGTAVVVHDKVFQLAEEQAIVGAWPRVWQRVNLSRFTDAVPRQVHPIVVLLDPESPAGGFERDWKRLDTGIAVHQGYAFQWFSLAIALAAIFFLVNFRKPGKEQEKK